MRYAWVAMSFREPVIVPSTLHAAYVRAQSRLIEIHVNANEKRRRSSLFSARRRGWPFCFRSQLSELLK